MCRGTGQHCESGLLRSAFDSSNVGSLFRVISQLQRHGARYPTTALANEIKKTLRKLPRQDTTIDFIFSRSALMNSEERSSQVRCRPVRRWLPRIFCFEVFTPFSRPDPMLSERRLSSVIGV